MINLHIHLDGSLRPETIIEYAKRRHVPLPTYIPSELEKCLELPDDQKDANLYYDLCEMTDWVLQSKSAITRAMMELVLELDEQGVSYAEIRFSPSECTLDGLRQRDAVAAALEGLKAGVREAQHIKANLILCVMAKMDDHEAYETLVEAKNHLRQGVCGLDILLDEDKVAEDGYDWLFQMIREEHIPFTIHAGHYNVNSLKKAISYGASRISIALHLTENEEILEEIKNKKITVECCPSSNVKLGSVASYAEHPIRKLVDRGISVCVGTDRQRVNGTTLQKEYDNLKKYLGFTNREIYQMNINAINGAFLTQDEKDRLRLEEHNIYHELYADQGEQ